MAKMAQQGKMGPSKPAKPEIPAKYGNPDTSTLVAVVVVDASKNVFEYKLVD